MAGACLTLTPKAGSRSSFTQFQGRGGNQPQDRLRCLTAGAGL